MFQLIESIRLEEGIFHNLFYHEQRMTKSLKALFGADEMVDLKAFLGNTAYPRTGLYKCRIVYDDLLKTVEFHPYQPRLVHTLQVIHSNISYAHKFSDRDALDQLFQNRNTGDDILIVKKGKITDASYANIALKRGNQWYTPDSPLLCGTMRQYLIDKNMLKIETVRLDDLGSFQYFKLINAMLGFDAPQQDISGIVI